jgi:hypothetical protein
MFSLILRKVPRSLWGQTALMLVVLAVVLAVLRALTFPDYFMGGTNRLLRIYNGWFAGWLASRRQANR